MPSAPRPQGQDQLYLPARPAEFGGAGMRPVDSFDPLTGQVVSGSPQRMPTGDFDPLTGQVVSGSPTPVAQTVGAGSPGVPGSIAGAKGGPSFMEKWQALGNSGIGDQLLALSAGLLQGRSFGDGLGRGFQNMLAVSQSGSAADMQRLDYALKLKKAQQEQEGQNLTAQRLIALGEDPENVRAAIGASVAGRPEALQNMLNNRFRKTPDAPSGYRQVDGGGLEAIAGGPADLTRVRAEAEAKAEDKTQTPLTTAEARAAAGIRPDDTRDAWRDPNGKVTFSDGQKETTAIREWQRAKREDGYAGTLQQWKAEQQGPRLITVQGPNGETITKRYNPQTGQAEDIPGATPAPVDNSGIPAGVDPGTYRKELAKATVAEQKGATQRAQAAANILPALERAEKAYRELHENNWIGPVQASGPSRWLGNAAGGRPEILRQEYEAAQKELELAKAQIAFKGQGAVTDAERRLMGFTFPRLDAASGETGLTTLGEMRQQFARTMAAPGLPTRQVDGGGQGASTGAVMSAPPGAVQALQQNPALRDQFDAKYGRGAAARALGGR